MPVLQISNQDALYTDKPNYITIKNRNYIMSNTNNDTSDIKQAAEHADGQQIEKNLQDRKEVDVPEALTKEEETPFIDETLRTDK